MNPQQKNPQYNIPKITQIDNQLLNQHHISQSYDNVQKIPNKNYQNNQLVDGYQSDLEYQDNQQQNNQQENNNDVYVNQSINPTNPSIQILNTQISNHQIPPQQNPQQPTPHPQPQPPPNPLPINQTPNTISNPSSNRTTQPQLRRNSSKSPNRYFSTGNSINTTSRSNQSINNNPIFISFGSINNNYKNNQFGNKIQFNNNNNNNMINNTTIINREKIITEKTNPPILIIPGNLHPSTIPLNQPSQIIKVSGNTITPITTNRPVSIPNTQIIHRSPSIQYAHPPYMESSKPLQSPKSQHHPNQFRRFVSFSNVQSHPSIHQQSQNISVVEQTPQVISSFPSTQFQSLHLLTSSNSSKIISIQYWYAEAITKYLQLSNKIQIISQTAHGIAELINVMLREQPEKQKQQFLKILKQRQTFLQQKLIEAQKQASQVIRQNNQFQQQFQSNSKLLHHQQNTNTIKSDNHEQLQKYKTQLNQLTQTNTKYQQQIKQLKQQNTDLQIKYKQELSLQQQSHSAQQKSNLEQQLTKTIQNQKLIIKKLEQELIQVHNEQNLKNQQMIVEQTELKNLQATFQGKRKAQQQKLMTLIQSKVAYINELQAEIIRYKTQIKNLKLVIKQKQKNDRFYTEVTIQQKTNSPNSNLKKISSDSSQMTKLQKLLNEKVQQLDKVKQKIFQIQEQFDKVIDEKNQKIKQLHQQIMELNKKQVMMNQNKIQYTQNIPIQVQQQLDYLKQLLTTKQSQLLQLKQATQNTTSLQSIIQQLHTQISTLKQTLKQKNQQQQKLQQTLQTLQYKIKNNNLNDTHEEQLSTMLDTIKIKQNQIIKMRETIQAYVKNIMELESQIKEVTVQYKDIEFGLGQQKKNGEKDPLADDTKHKQFDYKWQKYTKNSDVTKLKNMVRGLKKKIKQIQETTHQNKSPKIPDNTQQDSPISHTPEQLLELEQSLKAKQAKIKQLQHKLHKLTHQQDSINIQQLSFLKKKLAEYQTTASNRYTDNLKSHRNKNQHNINVFEQKIIYELKRQNQQLKNIIHLGSLKTTNNKNQHLYINNIQKRLNEFHIKLQQLILQNKQYENTGRTPRTMQNDVFQRQKINIIKKYHKQIQLLQTRIIDLQRYCSSLQLYQFPQQYLPIPHKQSLQQTTTQSTEQTLYFKQKNKQLQQRVNTLLKLNKQLKDKYQDKGKNINQQNNQFYLQQIKQLQTKIQEYEKKLTQIVSKYTICIEKQKINQQNTQKIIQLQSNINQLNTKILQLEQQKKNININLKNYNNKIMTLSTQSINLKTKLTQQDQNINQLQNTIKTNNKKIIEYQQQLQKQKKYKQKLKNSITKLQNQSTNKQQQNYLRKNYQQNINNQLKQKINQLQQQNIQLLKQSNHSKNQKTIDLELKISTLQSQIKQLSYQNRNLQRVLDENLLLKQIGDQKPKQYLQLIKTQNTKIHTQNTQLSSPQKNTQLFLNINYQIQLIRSIFIQLQTLIKQLHIKNQSRSQDILSKFKKQICIGFHICQEVNQLL